MPRSHNERWSLDFLSDVFELGRRFRIRAEIGDCTRECLALVAETSPSGRHVAGKLDSPPRSYCKLEGILRDNSTELTSHAILEW